MCSTTASILRPFVFILYIRDMLDAIDNGRYIIIADDTTIYISYQLMGNNIDKSDLIHVSQISSADTTIDRLIIMYVLVYMNN